MALSLKLISDPRYNQIEEDSQDVNNGPNQRDRAWQNAERSFLDELWHKYSFKFPKQGSTCPEYGETSVLSTLSL